MKGSGGRLTILPGDVIADRSHFVGCDVFVLLLLGRHADRDGWCRRSQRTMAEELGLNRVTVMRSLQRLAALGYVEAERATDPRGGNASSFYRIVKPAAQAELFAGDCTAETAPSWSAPPGVAGVTAPGDTHDTAPGVAWTTPPRSRHGDSTGTSPVERKRQSSSGEVGALASKAHQTAPSGPRRFRSPRRSVEGQRDLLPIVDAEAGVRPPPRRVLRAARIAPDWHPDDIGRAYGIRWGLSPPEVDAEAEKFRDYWLALGEARADWGAAWRIWVRRNAEKGRPDGNAQANRGRGEDLADRFANIIRRTRHEA